MARIAGNTGTLTLDGVRLGLTNITWTPTRDTPDATGMDSGGYKQTVDGNAGATFSATAHWDTAAGGQVPSVQTGGLVAFVLDIDTPMTRRYSGTPPVSGCRITSGPVTVDVNGTITYGIEAVVEGKWTEA